MGRKSDCPEGSPRIADEGTALGFEMGEVTGEEEEGGNMILSPAKRFAVLRGW